MILFQASNLGGGQHTVKLTSEAWGNSSLTLAVDYAQVYSTPSSQISYYGSRSSTGLSTGAIVGISIGAVLFALLAFILIFRRLWPSITFRLKRASKQNQPIRAFEQQISVAEPTSGPGLPTRVHGPAPLLSSDSSGTSNTLYIAADAPTNQMVTTPYTPDGKYRPDLVSPPQNVRGQSQDHRPLGSMTPQTLPAPQAPSSSATAQPQQARSSPSRSQQREPANGEIDAVPPPQYELDPS